MVAMTRWRNWRSEMSRFFLATRILRRFRSMSKFRKSGCVKWRLMGGRYPGVRVEFVAEVDVRELLNDPRNEPPCSSRRLKVASYWSVFWLNEPLVPPPAKI